MAVSSNLRLRLGLFGAGLVSIVGGLLAPATLAHHSQDSPTRFAHLPKVFDVDVTSSRALATECGDGTQIPSTILSFSDAGNPVPFAKIPEDALTWCLTVVVSPGLGGFEKDAVYVAAGTKIWVIPPGGCVEAGAELCPRKVDLSDPMATEIATNEGHALWLAFDGTGHFGYRLLAMSQSIAGGLWAIDRDGQTERIPSPEADWYPVPYGQPVVAPPTFGRYAGYLLIPRYPGDLLFVSPEGTAKHVMDFGGEHYNQTPVGVSFVPPELCELGASQGLFFQGMYSSFPPHHEGIRKFRGSDFAGKSGSALIAFYGTEHQSNLGYEGMLFLSPDAAGEPVRSIFHRDPDAGNFEHYWSGDFSDCLDPWSATVSDVRVDEGEAGSITRVVFRVRLASPPSQPVTVHYETRAGSAQDGSDFLPARGEVTLGEIVPGVGAPAGINAPVTSTTAEIEVSIVGDDATEGDEQFFLDLTDPGQPQVLAAQGVATIVDDDSPAPVIPTPPPPDADPIRQPADGGARPPAPTLEAETLAPAVTPVQTTAAAAGGPQLPPPAPPGSAPAPSAGPAAGPAPMTSPVGVPAFAQAPAPQIVPGIAGIKEEEGKAAPESDYAMLANAEARHAASPAAEAWIAAILLLVSGCGVAGVTARRSRTEGDPGSPQPSFCFVR